MPADLPAPTPTEILALHRTILANERTLLSYIRTGVMLAFGGVSFVELLPASPLHTALGGLSAGVGVIALGVGAWRFVRMRARYARWLTPGVASLAPP